MDLARLTGQPTTIEIDGRPYKFSELTIEALGRLQQFIKDSHPHPVEAIKPYLAGLEPEDRAELLDRARKDAAHWPPKISTSRGAAALLDSEEGQILTLWEALKIHQPATTHDEASRIFRRLTSEVTRQVRKAKAEGLEPELEYTKPNRIFKVAFGFDETDEEETGLPKAE